ncbi:MAG TPA: MarR family winged helix-turn-helix transcriptional regulator [Solirubrobacteraceae bacterium]|nr:MarR family winged helix-turn-helix transcriptional regulator [Solirubrobacteraceae bacterium]
MKKDRSNAQSAGELPAELADAAGRPLALGAALRRAWVGYQGLLDAEMARAGFGDRRFPDGRVLRMCAGEELVTASQLGRELGITRQGAAKIVDSLRQRGYIRVGPPSHDAREKALVITSRGRDYLTAQHRAAQRIERRVRAQIGDDGIASLSALLEALGGDQEQPRLRDYLNRSLRG